VFSFVILVESIYDPVGPTLSSCSSSGCGLLNSLFDFIKDSVVEIKVFLVAKNVTNASKHIFHFGQHCFVIQEVVQQGYGRGFEVEVLH
jgi:hypothetical protein